MKRIVVVEDEELIRQELVTLLERAGYEAEALTSFEEVTEVLHRLSPDLILLDLNLPNVSGFQICREWKIRGSAPVLVLTSREGWKDEIRALSLGADEYLTKPFRRERLLARIENVLKRYEGRANLIERERLLLDRNTYTLYLDGQSSILPQNQGKLLEALLAADGEAVSRDRLTETLWGTTEFIDENALQVNITRLKKTMRDVRMPYVLETVRGKGYRLVRKEVDDENVSTAE